MMPPVYELVKNDATVQSLLGGVEPRVYLFGLAPQDVQDPYVVWQNVSGISYPTLSCPPGADMFNIQFDVYGTSSKQVSEVGAAIRNAMERQAVISGYRGTTRDPETRRYRLSFDMEWVVLR